MAAIKTVPLDREMARLFLGGRGLGARLLWDLVGPEVKPLDLQKMHSFLQQAPLQPVRFTNKQPL